MFSVWRSSQEQQSVTVLRSVVAQVRLRVPSHQTDLAPPWARSATHR
jgi:hypothetical protein